MLATFFKKFTLTDQAFGKPHAPIGSGKYNTRTGTRWVWSASSLVLFLSLFLPVFSSDYAPELARVAILSFDDQTGTQDYAYMSNSLSDSINRSMQKNFTYERVSPEDATAALQKAKSIAQGETNKKKSNDKEEELLKIYKIMAKEIKADIIIYGFYTFNREEQNLEIKTRMYYAASQEFADIPDISNKVDNTIFGATEKTAQNIISEIRKMTSQVSDSAEAKTSSSPDNKTAPAEEKPADAGKIVLSKKLAKKFARFIDNYNGTITDNKTGLVWQKCATDKAGKRCVSNCQMERDYDSAVNRCDQTSFLNKKWSLPTQDELLSLVNPRASRPATFILFAPFTDHNKPYWSSTTKDETTSTSVSFANGSIETINRASKAPQSFNVRCVARPQ